MWPFDGWRKAREERVKWIQISRDHELSEAKRKNDTRLAEAKSRMLSKNCAFRLVNCQGEVCVHFYKGRSNVYWLDEDYAHSEGVGVEYIPPHCKLWSK